ncbi:hypothetical protein JXB22_04010 [candidate division WOR-3 bacterium]|nr:hypothetical protein [candidate division WOR-3 bacterium]
MKYLVSMIAAAFLAGCATSGTITGRYFRDHGYDYSVTFPDAYELSNHGARSPERVIAVKWRADLSVENKPTFAITIYDEDRDLIDVITREKGYHFKPEYYMNCEVTYEEGAEIAGREAYVIHYRGGYVEGKTVFIAFMDFVIKLEYITDVDFYSEPELIEVLESLPRSDK